MPTAATKASKAKATKSRKTAKRPAAKAAAKGRTSRTQPARTAPVSHYASQSFGRETATSVGETAERAVLIPVGAALIARERVVSTVNDTFSTYTSPSKTQAQLKRFERRGVTARKRLEREIRKTRVRVERDLRQRRRGIESALSDLEDRRETIARNVQDLPAFAGRVQERLQTLV